MLESAASFDPTTHLAWGDVAVDKCHRLDMIQFHLKGSKCDQFGAGSDIVVGCTGMDLCPVSAMLSYMAFQGDQPGPFFVLSNDSPATKP